MSQITAVSARGKTIVLNEKGAWDFLHKQLETLVLSPEEDEIRARDKTYNSAWKVPNTEPGWVTLSSGEKLTAFTVLTEHEGRQFSRMYHCERVRVTGGVDGIETGNPQAAHDQMSDWEGAHKEDSDDPGDSDDEKEEENGMKLDLRAENHTALPLTKPHPSRTSADFCHNIATIMINATEFRYDPDAIPQRPLKETQYKVEVFRVRSHDYCRLCDTQIPNDMYICEGSKGCRNLALHGGYVHYVIDHNVAVEPDQAQLVKAVAKGIKKF